jgi:2-polyprenyl-3-methyl-5-hydroxy-6-metoxy-1,4-benzoquinol methylase
VDPTYLWGFGAEEDETAYTKWTLTVSKSRLWTHGRVLSRAGIWSAKAGCNIGLLDVDCHCVLRGKKEPGECAATQGAAAGYTAALCADGVPVACLTCVGHTSLAGSPILEVGSGEGAGTAAMAEQGGQVTGIDINSEAIGRAAALLQQMELEATFKQGNATDLKALTEGALFDQIVFWAALEHMTVDERIIALRQAWDTLGRSGLLSVVETPNRLWPLDSHTSLLPYFNWLPYELGYRYSRNSPRAGFGDGYLDDHYSSMLEFVRRGHGVSFHEFDVAIGDHQSLELTSCMQIYQRRRNPARRIAWTLSLAGRTERVLARYSPGTDRAWFQPFLYLTLRKP